MPPTSAVISTRLTAALGIRHPILSAPMAMAAGGRLAAAVTRAGGLGLVGGGYGDADWLAREFSAAGNEPTGCGFITWSLAKKPQLLTQALAHDPRLLMLSFGDPAPFAAEIAASGAMFACQCQTLDHVNAALDAGAALIVAQGAEAGGHGQSRATMTLVPEVADFLARRAPQTLLVAAGGIADGRGLVAALALGADGIMMGTRFWAAPEALTHANHQTFAVASGGDGTVRSHAPDIARRLDWPSPFQIRVADAGFTRRWHGREADLAGVADAQAAAYADAFANGDAEGAAVVFGEAAGLIRAVEPAAAIIERTVAEAAAWLRRAPGRVSDLA